MGWTRPGPCVASGHEPPAPSGEDGVAWKGTGWMLLVAPGDAAPGTDILGPVTGPGEGAGM